MKEKIEIKILTVCQTALCVLFKTDIKNYKYFPKTTKPWNLAYTFYQNAKQHNMYSQEKWDILNTVFILHSGVGLITLNMLPICLTFRSYWSNTYCTEGGFHWHWKNERRGQHIHLMTEKITIKYSNVGRDIPELSQ